jgi:FixJ family two-component response regulator
MSDVQATVFVVDDDPSVREFLEEVLQSAAFLTRSFASPSEFLSQHQSAGPGCLVLDVGLPGCGGLDLQRSIAREHPEMPIIFIAGCRDVPVAVRAMKAGALDFLTKPLRPAELLAAVFAGVDRSRAALATGARSRTLRARHAQLSRREREVMALVTSGRPNRQIGLELGISEITVKVHRGRVMRKMRAASLAQLVDMSGRLGGVPLGDSTRPAGHPLVDVHLAATLS